jgi:hypothetical protein
MLGSRAIADSFSVLGEDRDDVAMATSEPLDDLLQSTPDVASGNATIRLTTLDARDSAPPSS